MKEILKAVSRTAFLIPAFPLALLSGFGRIEALYLLAAQCCALAPGLPGDYLRTAFYRLTLQGCGPDSRIQFGSYFSHSRAAVGRGVYIGSYCILGRCIIGDRTQIASGVQILSGRRQHGRDLDGKIEGSRPHAFQTVEVGPDCWIGAGAILMAQVESGSTVGAGSVVVQPVPERCTVAGNPARVVRSAAGHSV